MKPPIFAQFLLKYILKKEDRFHRLGDFEEVFQNIRETEKYILDWKWYWRQVIRSIPTLIIHTVYWSFTMFNNYIKIALRNLKKYRGYSFINISGLAIGMASCILMLLWIQDELSFDRFHENKNVLYRVIAEIKSDDQTEYSAQTPPALATTLIEEYPEIVNATRFVSVPKGWLLQYKDKSFLNDRLGSADPSFFDMFSFHFLKGDPKTALKDAYSIVVTENFAQKYFGKDEPLDKIIKIHGNNFKVTGVIKNIPKNSHIQFDFIFPTTFWKDAWGMDLNSWSNFQYFTYVQLQNDTETTGLSQKIATIINKNLPQQNSKIYLQSIKDVYLHSEYKNDLSGLGSIKTVSFLFLIALGILIMACINFMNLSTARSSNRIKEICMRKVIGANRKDIVKQFLSEAIILSVFALFLAFFIVYFILPTFNLISGKQISLNILGLDLILGLIIITIFTGFLSGSYPAFFLSTFQPVQLLKTKLQKRSKHRLSLRSILVICQFVFTIVLIISSTVIYRQLNFIWNKPLGFDKDHVVYFLARGQFGKNYEAAKNVLLQNPYIINVTKSDPPYSLHPGSGIININWEGKNSQKKLTMYETSVDYDYLLTFNMEMAQGRFFSREHSTDVSNIILNETAVKKMSLTSPIGKRFSFNGVKGEIIGIMKDFHHSSLYSDIKPMFFKFNKNNIYLCVKIDPKNISETIDFLENKWNEYVPGFPFTYDFLDETINSYYQSEKQIETIFRYFTLLAISIACLGLFGLAAFTAEQRTKEIGIRKILGATILEILFIVSREFTKWVFIAALIACPIAWIIMEKWLQHFAYHINLGIDIFLFSSILALFLTLFTVSYQIYRAARINPIESFKYE